MRSTEVSGARVAVFPMSRRSSDIRESARILDGKHGRDAEAYWRSHCRGIAEKLIALGCSAEEASRQVLDFQHSVQIELMNMHEDRAELETHQA